MSLIFTTIAKIKDWQMLQKLNSEVLVVQARAAGATRYQVYRNVNDASQALVLVELPHQEAVLEISDLVLEQMDNLPREHLADDRVWEPVGWEGIG